MQVGLVKKLKPIDVRDYKKGWETRCRNDIFALVRDRTGYYATQYKNPSRIRELFIKLSPEQRARAVSQVSAAVANEEAEKSTDAGYQWQRTTRKDERTSACLVSALEGELWPHWLPRVGGHPEDPYYPTDLRPPFGMTAFHTFDLYCQVLVKVLLAASYPIPLEALLQLSDEEEFDAISGQLVIFRERAKGKGVRSPRVWEEHPTYSVAFRKKRGDYFYKSEMTLRTMYIFSDSASLNLRNDRVCGVGLFGGANIAWAKVDRKSTCELYPW